jgi:hypothetical protein
MVEKQNKSAAEKAQNIVYNGREREERNYGNFFESMERTAKIASLMGNKELNAIDCYNVLIALKLSREQHAHKEDNIVDAIGYLTSLNDYKNK